MQTQISLTMEKVQTSRHMSFDQQMRHSLTHSTDQCKSMLEILQRHKKHLDHRLGNFRDKEEEMDKTFYEIKISDEVANSHQDMMGMGGMEMMEFEDKDKPKKPSISPHQHYNQSNKMLAFHFEDSKHAVKRLCKDSGWGDEMREIECHPKVSKYDQERVEIDRVKEKIEGVVERSFVNNGFGPHEQNFDLWKMQIAGSVCNREVKYYQEKYGIENIGKFILTEEKKRNIQDYAVKKLKHLQSN